MTVKNDQPGTLIALFILLLSSLLFAVAVIIVRVMARTFSGPCITFFRLAFGTVFCLVFLALPVNKKNRSIHNRLSLTLRGFFGALGIVLFFISIELVGSSRATLLLNTFPIWVALFGLLLFKEKIRPVHWAAILLCFSGAILIFGDGTSLYLWGAAAGLLAGCVRGIAIHMIKISGARNHPVVVYFSVCLFGLVLFPFVKDEFQHIKDLKTIGILFLIALLLFLSQVLLAWALRAVTPTTGSIMIYSNIPFTLGLGFFIDEYLTMTAWSGAALIAAALMLPVLFQKRYNEKNLA